MNLNSRLAYYRDCYKEDSSDLNLWNLLKLKKEDCLLLQGSDDLGAGFLPRLPIPADFAEQMSKRVEVYQRERVLLYASFIFVGKLEINGEMKSVVSPLLFNEAEIEQDNDDYYFSVSRESVQINEPLTQLLKPESNNIPSSRECGFLYQPSLWTSWLKDSPLDIDSLGLLNFPKLAEMPQIKQAVKGGRNVLLPASMLVFIERSASSRGVLHEIETIIESQQQSAALLNLFEPQAVGQTDKLLKYDYLPGLLSSAQKKVLSIAANASIGCTSGPPGTGKSYTIAAVAAEHMARGESVLIAADNDSALDVIAHKLDVTFGLGDISIRAGQKVFLKKLKSYVADLLSGYFTEQDLKNPADSEQQLQKLNKKLERLEKQFVKFCRAAIVRGQRLRGFEQREQLWFKKVYLSFARRGIRELVKQWQVLEDVNEQQMHREALSRSYLSELKNLNLQKLIETQRKSLQAFNKAIRSRTSKRQFELFDEIEYRPFFSAFPVWLASLNALHRVLPLKAQMFDLLIIDEATQCNISSCLPALYRAKRVMVVGDTKQLRHYSFLARAKEQQLLSRHNLTEQMPGVVSYRDNSILDLTLAAVASHKQVAFLDEHFRSKPELINFSNTMFYQNKLKIMQHRPCTTSGHLLVHRSCGCRDRSGINKVEAAEVIKAVTAQINKDAQTGVIHSLGIISPFRHQAEYLAKQISLNLSESDILKHNIRAATPFGFQGEERDIIYISFAVDNNSRRAAVYLNKADVFNVTVTRARQLQRLFLSLDENQLPDNSLLKSYINSVNEFEVRHTAKNELDKFQRAVIKLLDELGIDHWPGYTVAGTEADILCRSNGRYLALDLIGYPGPWTDYFELNSYKLFKRAGIDILPVSYGLWIADKQACVEQILSKLDMPPEQETALL
ncbi:AAA domain-containing protein [Psychromonas aquimarina]|uniref:AAA domain-containing protein n=1 Tax=Psychromonas aquimarina TaxID=444919 RepID=UPI000417C749|nr:AAA domain-containing protein [Psychromonas aquimarina]